MPSVCLYFEVHQPYRVRNYDVFQIGRDHQYFDDALNGAVMRKVAQKCYVPANQLLLQLIERCAGRFRVAFSLSGVALEQMQLYAPEALESFQELAASGAVELLAETYYHSLSSLYDPAEFREQVAMHGQLMKSLFGVTPTCFRNTELIYDDRIGNEVAKLGYRGVLAEGADDILGWRSPNFVYGAAVEDTRGLGLLLKNYRLSDDIAFRFSDQRWAHFPLTAEKYARWLHELDVEARAGVRERNSVEARAGARERNSVEARAGARERNSVEAHAGARERSTADTVNLFVDYETFGEHHWVDTGIFDFLEHLPEAILGRSDWSFKTPSETLASYPAVAPLSFSRTVSWADLERDLTAWSGNEMQRRALERVYLLGDRIKRRNNPALLALWRKLTTSDHFYYMSTKRFSDGDVHAYFSPYESPYEAFINYMNVLSDIESSLLTPARTPAHDALDPHHVSP